MNIQIFGTRKCQDTRKAERFWKERRIRVQLIDLGQKGMSPGELRSVAARVGGALAMLDRDGKRFVDKGLKYARLSAADAERLLLEDPLLVRTPVVRDGQRATIGYCPEVWETWLRG